MQKKIKENLISESLDSTAPLPTGNPVYTQRALSALRATNKALLRSNTEEELMNSICNLITETKGYRLAWVGSIDSEQNVIINAQSGFQQITKLEEIQNICPEHYLGCQILGSAITTGKPQINQNILNNKNCRHCWEHANRLSYNSTIALPLIYAGQIFGILNIYCEEYSTFDTLEIELLNDLADDLAFGISVLRTRLERDKAIKQLEQAKIELEDKVTQRTRDLQLANEKLKELDQLKSLFIASMSHELRTPLNAIIGFTGILLRELPGELNNTQKDQLNRISQSGKRLLELISDVIDIAKLEGHRIEIFTQPLILNDVITDVKDALTQQISKKELNVSIDMDDNIFLYTDRKRLHQSIYHLFSNAVKYTEHGSISIKVKEQSGNITFSITDTGIGIADKDQASVFQAFERLNTHLKVKAGGAGIGLYLTRKLIVEILQGSIGFKSKAGKGSTFYFSIPQILTDKNIENYQQATLKIIN